MALSIEKLGAVRLNAEKKAEPLSLLALPCEANPGTLTLFKTR